MASYLRGATAAAVVWDMLLPMAIRDGEHPTACIRAPAAHDYSSFLRSFSHSVTDLNGHVFAWGSNARGQLGFLYQEHHPQQLSRHPLWGS
ncbi:Regulator of chromosome condensation 1/beta-lactamase-inhibitor protein II [Phytophthora cactorum]|nr:Regulator of chromosome condensation 1/beta-lactamase-inhibitor protein II [Phytophthora cactorum]